MAERVFSIDFGSAYTKVALRRDPTADSTLLDCPGAEVDFLVPTVVAMDQRGTKARFEFGDRASDIKPGGGIHVFTNFKKDLFVDSVTVPDKPPLPPLDALLQSEEFVALAGKYGVFAPQVSALRTLAGAARALSAGPGERVVSVEAQRQTNAAKVACHFFTLLREQVLAACDKLNVRGLKFEEFPVRVAVPALSTEVELAQQSGCKLLREALHRAGWPLHPDQPFVTEPEANAVGILTKATNLLFRNGRINLGEMLSKGPLNTVLKCDPNHPSYRAFVIDIGAFTTDFGSLYVNTDGKPYVATVGAGFQVGAHSVRLGATDLEAMLPKALPTKQRVWLESVSRKEFSAFQRNVFGDGKGYRVPGIGVIGGEGDREAIDGCVAEFSKRLVEELRKFCAGSKPAQMQELILAGGGSNIPAVRDALIAAAKAEGNEFVKVHAPDLKRGKAGTAPLVDKLDANFARGGSALGGASVYFESQYH